MTDLPDINNLAHWFPEIDAAGLPVPKTVIIHTDADLVNLLDGVEPTPPGSFEKLVADIRAAGREVGEPFFLRTGHTSGKHDWAHTCFVGAGGDLIVGNHIARLVEYSHTVDMFGLPTDTWAVRELLDTKPLFFCDAWSHFPVVREFRVFANETEIEAIYPYWPADAVEEGHPDTPGWRDLLAEASAIDDREASYLRGLSRAANVAVGGGYWSIDWLQDARGYWWLTDMAEGARSWKPGMPR